MAYRDRNQESTMTAPRVTRERAVERTGWTIGPPGPGMVLGLFGALALFVSLLLAWRDGGVHAHDVPLRFLVDGDVVSHHPSLLLVLVPLLVLAVIGSLLPGSAVLRAVAGIGTLIVVLLFGVQVADLVPDDRVVDVLDTGAYVAAIGAVLMLLSALVSSGWHSRRTVERYVDEPVDEPVDRRVGRSVDAR